MRAHALAFALALALPASLRAGVTTATRMIGGPGGHSCCGPQNPPTLCDGSTLASATVEFEYDDAAQSLSLVVTNDSPVTPGVANPLITQLYFNTPHLAVTGLSLVSQSGAGGASPAFGLAFDRDLLDGSNPIKAGCLGAFNARLSTSGGVPGGIANAAAGTIAAPAGTWVVGPATFVLSVIGPSASGLTASDFADSFSMNPPGVYRVNLGAHFQAGGPNLDSGRLSGASGCAPAEWMIGRPRIGCTVTFVMSAGPGCFGCLGASANPGPTIVPNPPFPDLVVPLGDPMIGIIVSLSPPATVLTQNVAIPLDPQLVGVVVYFAVVVADTATGQLFVSDAFDVAIEPAGPCS